MTAPNPHRGEVALGGHKLIVVFNSFCALEKAMGKTHAELLVMMQFGVGFGMNELRTCIRVFLDKEMTDDEVGDFIDDLGMVEVPIPKDRRVKGGPDVATQWLAQVRLGEALEMYLDPKRETRANPLKAA